MQTLGLDPEATRAEGRFKRLFWPSVANDADVDSLTTQGFWICFIVSVVTACASIVSGRYLGIADALFFYLGGNGVRQRSTVAAICVFAIYALGGIAIARVSYAFGGSSSLIRFLLSALLLANVRAVRMASKWRGAGGADESPLPLNETLGDKLADILPRVLWPKARYPFYLFACVEIGGLALVLFRQGL